MDSPEGVNAKEFKTGIRRLLRKSVQEAFEDGSINFEVQCFDLLKNEIKGRPQEMFPLVIGEMLKIGEKSNCLDRVHILELIDYFFLRSHFFRESLLFEARDFLEIFCETDPIHRPLPGKAKNGEKLKVKAILTVKKWEEKFADRYILLGLLVDYLKSSKSLDYDGVSAEQNAVKARKEKLEKRRNMLTEKTFAASNSKFIEIKEESERILIELSSALKILVPSFIDEEVQDQQKPSTSTGKPSSSHVTVVIPDLNITIQVNSENDAIAESVLDSKTLLKTKISNLNRLMKRASRLGKISENLVLEMIGFREELRKNLAKAEDLTFLGLEGKKRKSEKAEEDDEDEFIDVDDFSVDQILMIQYSKEAEDFEEKTSEPQIEEKSQIEVKKPEEVKKKPLIPIVPYGLDLMYWGETRKDVQIPKNNADCHRFWRPPDEDAICAKPQECVYTQRVFTFIGEERRSDKICRASLPNGLLCPRRDFKSCPLHGRIVERDDFGNPTKESDKKDQKKRDELKRKKETAAIVKDIEAEMGIDLSDGPSNKKKKLKRLKDDREKTHGEDVRNRLEKKLLDPKAIKRVSQVLDASRKARLEKNFGQQFSHMGV